MSPTAILVEAGVPPPCVHTRALRRAGLHIAEASCGAEVRRLMSIHRPDAVLVDAAITPSASADVWRALDQSTPSTRVVMFGEFRHDAVRDDAREHGAVCLAPHSEEDLVAAVRELVKRYQTVRHESERLRAELTANMRDFYTRFKRSCVLDNQFLSPPDEGLVVLVAEDEETVRRFLATTLERGGYLVLEARDGKEAVRTLWSYAAAVRLMVLDWAMPGLTGLEIVRTMRKVSPETRLLICTGSPEPVIRRALQGEAVEGILEKPFQPMDLLTEVERQMRVAAPVGAPRSGHAGHWRG